MLYTWADATIAAVIVLAASGGALAQLAWHRRRETRLRDLERTLRIERYADPPRVDLAAAIEQHMGSGEPIVVRTIAAWQPATRETVNA